MQTGSQRELSGLLELIWNPKEDTLWFPQKPIVIPSKVPITKRQVLSSVSSTFDPVGFISPVLVPAKVIMSLWDKVFDWDAVLPDELQKEYNRITSEIEKASELITPHCLDIDKTLPVDMHVFCEACPTTAAGCCVFFVQNHKVKFIASKVKIASSKHARTVPQWELIAMVLGARLGVTIREIFAKDFPSISSHYSTICLHWLFSHKSLNVFTRNRKTEIIKLTDLSSWSHVRSGDNPADILSRGCTSEDLQHSSLWERGPPWLTDHSLWPTWSTTGLVEDSSILAAAAQAYDRDSVQSDASIGSLQNLIEVAHFKTYESLLRTMSHVLRFISNLKQACDKTHLSQKPLSVVQLEVPVPTASEISYTEVILLRAHQIQHFRQEREYLLKEQTRFTSKMRPHPVRQFNLKLNPCGLLVAPRRLKHPMLDRDAKKPTLISKKSQFTTLLVWSVHERQLHAGVKETVIALRKRFWCPSARGEVTKILRRCVRCRYHVGVPFKLPPSPALPDFRLNKMKLFSTVGIDFTGHLIVKNGSKTQKCYVCLFTCSTTPNVNLEIVNDMTTDQFLQAIRRHCAVYGIPSLMLCDNAKTSVKGNEEIQVVSSRGRSASTAPFRPEENSDEAHSYQVTTLWWYVRMSDWSCEDVNQESPSPCLNRSV